MTSNTYQNQKRKLLYSKSDIERAGRSIRRGCKNHERGEAIKKIQNYRETHLYPLMLIRNHLNTATNKVSHDGIVARRLKMLTTIIDKLERPSLDGKTSNTINVTSMQDIGGCRAIVKNLKELNALHKKLMKSRSNHAIVKTYDYLEPKDSGYSGIHLVYSCFHKSLVPTEWSKTKIEVQLRTSLQHAWATSLEIVDTLEGIKLKTSMEGNPEWRRFFKLSGHLVAHKEGCYVLLKPDVDAFREELRELEITLGVRKKLTEFKLAMNLTTDSKKAPKDVLNHKGMFLVELIIKDKNISDDGANIKINSNVTSYESNNMKAALEHLANAEADDQVLLSVLVSAGDVRSLKKAYPNYLGSTNEFQDFLTSQIN